MSNEDDDGLGLDEFLNFDPDSQRGGGGHWFQPWKKKRQIDLWLHTESKIRAVWNHQIPFEIEIDEKNQDGEKTGRKTLKLSWPRFVSPDLASIHANQYFRDKNVLRELLNKDPKTSKPIGGDARAAFMRDPFLILREYLWHAIDKKLIAPDAVVFEWVDHKNKGELIQWTAGEMSRQTKRGFNNRGHSLDTKLEYIFVVVDNDKPGDGPKITRETKLLGDKMRDEIKKQIESRGEEGDPFKSPYCFRWKFDPDSKTPMKSYDAFRIDKNVCTPEVWQAIGGAPDPEAGEKWDIVEAHDTSEYARVNDGDMDKIRQCFEQAAQIDLPLEAIFSDDPDIRRSVVTGAILSTSAPRSTPSSGGAAGAARPNPGAAPGAARPGASQGQAASRPASGPSRSGTASTAAPASTTAPASGPQPRRKKVVEQAPPKEPEVEKIPCEDCGHPMLPTETKCPKCGAEYDVGDSVVAPEPAPSKPQPAAPSGAKRPGAPSAQDQTEAADLASRKCIACGSERLEKVVDEADGATITRCGNCGCDQGDQIPF